METILADFFLTRLSLRRKMESELTRIWDKVAAKLATYHHGVITTSWIDKIQQSSTSLLRQVRKFLIKAGKFVTLGQLIQALKSLHKARMVKILIDVNYYVTNQPVDQPVDQRSIGFYLKNQDKLYDDLVRLLASNQYWYEHAAALSQIGRLSGMITTKMVDPISKSYTSLIDQAKEYMRQIQQIVYGYEFAFACNKSYHGLMGNQVTTVLSSSVELVLQHPEDPAKKRMHYHFFNTRIGLFSNLKRSINSHQKNKIPGWRILANEFKTYYPDRLSPEDIDDYDVPNYNYTIIDRLLNDYGDWEDSTIDRLVTCLKQAGLHEIAQEILVAT